MISAIWLFLGTLDRARPSPFGSAGGRCFLWLYLRGSAFRELLKTRISTADWVQDLSWVEIAGSLAIWWVSDKDEISKG
jgi:hypothetical protein